MIYYIAQNQWVWDYSSRSVNCYRAEWIKLELESDSLKDVNMIKVENTFIHEFITIIDDIKYIHVTKPLPSIATRHVLKK